jgi:hypothetical protein
MPGRRTIPIAANPRGALRPLRAGDASLAGLDHFVGGRFMLEIEGCPRFVPRRGRTLPDCFPDLGGPVACSALKMREVHKMDSVVSSFDRR